MSRCEVCAGGEGNVVWSQAKAVDIMRKPVAQKQHVVSWQVAVGMKDVTKKPKRAICLARLTKSERAR